MNEIDRVPLIIGVTGHRRIHDEDVSRFAQSVTDILVRYQSGLPNTDLVLLSSLAIGADQIAAQSALAVPGVRIIAVLPMSLHEYRKDFSPSDLEHFDELLHQCAGVIDVSSLTGMGFDKSPDFRDALYQNSGQFIARNSAVLIAAWDGDKPESVGGTADIVHYKAAGLTPLRSRYMKFDDSPVDSGQILQCLVRRDTSTHEEFRQGDLYELDELGNPRQWKGQIDSYLMSLDKVNQMANWSIKSDGYTSTERLLGAADALAIRLQSRYRLLLKILLLSGAIALTSVAAFDAASGFWTALLVATSLVVLGTVWWLFRRLDLKADFQEIRALGEGTRVQHVWLNSGIQECVADVYLIGQSGPAVWIRQALRGCFIVDAGCHSARQESADAPNWMVEQIRYFRGTDETPGAISKTFRKARVMKLRAAAAAIVAMVALLGNVFVVLIGADVSEGILVAMRLMWAVGFAVTIALVTYGEIMGFRQLSARYAVTAPIFEQGIAELSRAKFSGDPSSEDALGVIRFVGIQALRESGDWFALHSGREVRPV